MRIYLPFRSVIVVNRVVATQDNLEFLYLLVISKSFQAFLCLKSFHFCKKNTGGFVGCIILLLSII